MEPTPTPADHSRRSAAIVDHAVIRESGAARSVGGIATPPSKFLGPVLRAIVLAAAVAGLRQSELIGLR